MPVRLSVDELTRLATRALKRAGASKSMARSTAQALVAADMEGLPTHGVSRIALYAQHLREGRADGSARPKVIRKKGGACLIDACGGLAFPAAALAVKEAVKRARRYGVAFSGVTNSHHFGAARQPGSGVDTGAPRPFNPRSGVRRRGKCRKNRRVIPHGETASFSAARALVIVPG